MIGVRVFGVVRGPKSGAGGSFYYHYDWHASLYVKVVLDQWAAF
jgi:hypothetical protein